MSYLFPRFGFDGVGIDGRVVYNKGGGDPVGDFVQNTLGSVTDVVDNALGSVEDVVNPVIDSVGLKDVREGLTDTWHDISPTVSTIAKFTPLAPVSYAYDAYDAARRYGDTGDFGDLAYSAANAYLASYGMPGTEQTGFMNGNPDGGLSSVFDSGSPSGVDTGGTMITPEELDTSAFTQQADYGTSADNAIASYNQPDSSSPSWFNQATSQEAAPVVDRSITNTGQVMGSSGQAINTGKDWSNYTYDALKGKTGMDFGTLVKVRALGNLFGAYQANQRQGQLNDLYNQRQGAYDTAMSNYNTLTGQIQSLQANPTEYFNSPEWQAQNSTFLANLARRDAAAGRRSQYGARAQQMQNNFLAGLNAKTQALSQARGSVPSADQFGLNSLINAKYANENAIGQNIAGAAGNYFAPQLM